MKKLLLSSLILLLATTVFADELRDNLYGHISYLAADEREGRGINTKGLDEAADYIRDQFEQIGLDPPFDGSYFQPFEMGWGVELGSGNYVTLGDTKLDVESGIMPMGFSSVGEISAPVVFAGYGITAPEYDYDDYGDLDVEDKIVLVLRYEPGQFDTSSVFEGVHYTGHSALRSKASNAKHQGAAGMLLVEGPLYVDDPDEESLYVPRSDEPYMDCGMPAFWITRAGLSKLFPNFELGKLQRSIDTNTAPRSYQISEEDNNLTMHADLAREYVTVKNVGGMLRGGDDVLVVGAHYDHLGFGQSGSLDERTDVVHNGADDNASGVGAMIEVARMLQANPTNASVLFVGFTAEETGLGGSSHLVKNFPGGMDQVRAMLNLDMVGRVVDNKLTVQACKTAEEFTDIVDAANEDVGLTITCKGDGYGPSDHMNFYLEEKPVLYLFTGAHEDYHKSTDDTEKINFEGVVQCTNLAESLIREVDAWESPLTYVKSEEPSSTGGGRFRVSFGSIPDYSQPDSLIGVLLSGAREGGPAAEAGIEGGDLLTKMGDVILNNIYDLVFALKTYAPGDTVEVRYIREGEEQVTHAVLKAPDH